MPTQPFALRPEGYGSVCRSAAQEERLKQQMVKPDIKQLRHNEAEAKKEWQRVVQQANELVSQAYKKWTDANIALTEALNKAK